MNTQTEKTTDTIKNILVNRQRTREMIDITLLEKYTTQSYLDHVEETLDKIAEKHAGHIANLLKMAIFHPTVSMLHNHVFPISPVSSIEVDDPSYIQTTMFSRYSPSLTLIHHFDQDGNIIDTTYTIISPGTEKISFKINETTKELIFLTDNNIKDLSPQTDVDLLIHDLHILIQEIFTYLNTSYLYRKNSLSLKSLKTK